eukprot:569750-Amphidinium_carterae.1
MKSSPDPGLNVTRQELLDSDDPIPVQHIRLVTGMIGRQCWHPACLLQGFQLCERRNCNEYACGAHSFSIFLPDGSLTAIGCSKHRRPDVSNKYLPFRRMSCCKCGSDSNIVGCMFEGCDHYWCRNHCMRIDGNGDLEGIQAFWCACHKTTIPRNSDYALVCGSPEE